MASERGTIACIENRLLVRDFVLRYDSAAPDDGLPPGEGAFPACSLWLDDCLALIGRLTGNFPQAFSHVALVGTALNLREQPDAAPAEQRGATST